MPSQCGETCDLHACRATADHRNVLRSGGFVDRLKLNLTTRERVANARHTQSAGEEPLAGLAARHARANANIIAGFVFAGPIRLGDPGTRHGHCVRCATNNDGFGLLGGADAVGHDHRNIQRIYKCPRRISQRRTRLRHRGDGMRCSAVRS